MPASAGMGVIGGSVRAAALDGGGGLVAGASASIVGGDVALWLGRLVAGPGVGALVIIGGVAWLGLAGLLPALERAHLLSGAGH